MRLRDLARATGVNRETIRYYHRVGLLPVPTTRYGEMRRYTAADAAQLRLLRLGRSLGFSIRQLKEVTARPREAVAVARARVACLRSEIGERSARAEALDAYLKECAEGRCIFPDCRS